MKAIQALFGVVASVCAAQAVAGGSLDLSLSNDAARIEYDAAKVGSGLHVSASLQHHENDGDLVGIGAHVVDVREPNSPLYIGVGGKVFLFKEDDFDGGALAVGGFLRYQFPQVPDLSVAGYSYYAPRVVSFNETENLLDADVRVQFSLLPTARVYTGYRYSRIKIEDVKSNVELEQGIHFGLKVDF